MSTPRPAARPGFTLVELMIVITVILILASMILVIRPANPEGLANGQRMLASMIRSAKQQALMNRAALPRPPLFSATGTWSPSDFRYRVLIKCDPTDPDRHLREMVIAVGMCGVGGSPTKYVWFSPDAPVLLPPGVFFVPPTTTGTLSGWVNPAVTMPAASVLNSSGTSSAGRRSVISPLSDEWNLMIHSLSSTYAYCGVTGIAPRMRYRPLASPLLGVSAPAYFDSGTATNGYTHEAKMGGREWYFIELGPDGSLAHNGRVMLVVADGVVVPTANASVRFERPDRFAAVLVRRNGEVALSADTSDFEETALK